MEAYLVREDSSDYGINPSLIDNRALLIGYLQTFIALNTEFSFGVHHSREGHNLGLENPRHIARDELEENLHPLLLAFDKYLREHMKELLQHKNCSDHDLNSIGVDNRNITASCECQYHHHSRQYKYSCGCDCTPYQNKTSAHRCQDNFF